VATRTQIRAALAALDEAPYAAAWQQAAEDLDALLELDAWRAEDDSDHYDAPLLRDAIRQMEALREQEEPLALFGVLQESLYRHLNELAEPDLYGTAWGGPKLLVSAFLDTAEQAIDWLASAELPDVTHQQRLALFQRAHQVYGRTALMLSGGATLGFHHLGVVKALFEHDLLPHILSGASMGAMIAGGICTRTDDELTALFANPDSIKRDGLLWLPPGQALKQRHLLEPDQLYRTILHNCGDATFGEAHKRTGRTLNISVSPTRRRQKPRVLSHLTTPNVLIASGALASSAVPGLFPPAQLRQRVDGEETAYAAGERWIDGALRGDLPMFRVGRLHNVNHFVVSQTNPHVLPFVSNRQQRGFIGWARQLLTKAAHRQGVNVVSLARQLGHKTPLAPALDVVESLTAQDYGGDIDIFPPVPARDFTKVVSNPSPQDLQRFILNGERGAWSRLVMVRDQTRIGRALERGLADAKRRAVS
jgi:NTE family protein